MLLKNFFTSLPFPHNMNCGRTTGRLSTFKFRRYYTMGCNNGWGGGCLWIIILIIILFCCCGNGGWGSGCGNGCGNGCGMG